MIIDVMDESALVDEFDEMAIMCYNFGYSNDWIYDNFLVSKNRLYKLLDYYGIDRKTSYNSSIDKHKDNIVEFYRDGRKMEDIASILGISIATVSNVINEEDKNG